MDAEVVSRITVEELPRIRTVVWNTAAQGASRWLAAWGAINVGAWFLLGSESRELLRGLLSPSDTRYLLLHGGLILGVAMLAFAGVGLAARFRSVIFLNGLTLIAAGLWNVTSDFIAVSALQSYSYAIVTPGAMWILIGICQVVWGVRQLVTFTRMAGWSVPRLSRRDPGDMKKTLRRVVAMADDPQGGLITACVTRKGLLGLDITPRTAEYKGVLSADMAIMVSLGLDDCVALTRQDANEAAFSPNGIVAVQAERDLVELSVTPLSMFVLKAWCGKPVDAADVRFAAEQKALTLPMIRTCLASEDPGVRAASVTALATVSEEGAASLAGMCMDDSSPIVQAAALRVCAQLKVAAAGAKAIDLLWHPDPNVRISAASFLSAVPEPRSMVALEEAIACEATAPAMKALKYAARVQSRRPQAATC
ncbi:MAG: HEAT repeat domain-containing protein [Sedimentisphaerales bacterium]|nr:HEAT repeat domain-containing protein [Sedimentisphaerales bacterium]